MALGDDGRVERSGETDRDPVVGLVHFGRVASLDLENLGTLDEPLRSQESDGQLVLESGRSHRDSHGDGVLAGPGRPDLEWFLDDDIVFDAGRPLLFDFQNGDTPGITHGSAL